MTPSIYNLYHSHTTNHWQNSDLTLHSATFATISSNTTFFWHIPCTYEGQGGSIMTTYIQTATKTLAIGIKDLSTLTYLQLALSATADVTPRVFTLKTTLTLKQTLNILKGARKWNRKKSYMYALSQTSSQFILIETTPIPRTILKLYAVNMMSPFALTLVNQ